MPKPRLLFLHSETNRHGKEVFYLRRGHGPRIRLPTPDDPDFAEAYDRALSEPYEVDQVLPSAVRRDQLQRRYRRIIVRNLYAARRRATEKGLPYALTLDWAMEEGRRLEFRCALTGIEFFSKAKPEGAYYDPFVPSLDRIEASGGYVPGNVRIVIYALNVMLNEWGQDVFERVAGAYRYARKNERRSLTFFQGAGSDAENANISST